MKIRLTYTLDLNDDERRAIGLSLGKPLSELATYEEVQLFYRQQLDTVVRDAISFPLREYYRKMGAKFADLADQQKA